MDNLLKSSLGPLARSCIHQETVSRQLSRSIFHLTKIEMTWRGAIIRIWLKRRKAKMQSLFELSLDHYWSQVWSPSPDIVPTRNLVGHLNRSTSIWPKIGMALGGAIVRVGLKQTPGPQNAATVRVIPWTIIEVRPGPLARYKRP